MLDTDREYTISEVTEITEYPKHVLRYYENEFELDIPRNGANHRYYTYKEIEVFKYIQSLQDKGFTNKQIKLIMNSPEVLVNEQQEETAVTSLIKKDSFSSDSLMMITKQLEKIIADQIKPEILEIHHSNSTAIMELKEEVVELKKEIQSKERDVLICENAKLKMKVKEKAYEVADLKEKLKRERYSNKNIIKKIFKK